MGKRCYDDGCAAAHALNLVGERWALLVVRELLLGPKRFTDLRRGLPAISPNVLAQRLRELERGEVVRRRRLPPPAGAWVYELTAWGHELEPVLRDLGRWGARSPALPRKPALGTDSLVLSMRTMFDARGDSGPVTRYELRLDEDCFRAALGGGDFEIARGSAERPAATITTDPATLAELIYGGGDLSAALESGALRLEGDRVAAERLLAAFSLPEPVAV